MDKQINIKTYFWYDRKEDGLYMDTIKGDIVFIPNDKLKHIVIGELRKTEAIEK